MDRSARAPSALALSHLDAMRGLAALLVLVNHVRGLFWVDYDHVPAPSRALQLVYLFTGMGHECVVIFFVLSGFFIGHSVLTAHREGRWSYRAYLVRRFARLYVVLLPALLSTALWDRVGMALFGTAGIYGGHVPDAPHMSLLVVTETSGPLTFLGNALFLQHFYVSEYGSNSPLWSLPYEWWYYVAFPLLFRAAVGSESGRARAGMAALGLGILVAMGVDGLIFALVWGLGVVVAARAPGRPLSPRLRLPVVALALAGFGVALLEARGRFLTGISRVNDLALGVATAALVHAIVRGSPGDGPRSAAGRLYARAAAGLAGFSYTLYLVHYPVVAFAYSAAVGWLGMESRFAPSLSSAAILTGLTAAIALLYAYPFSRLTEARTEAARAWLDRRLGGRA